MSELCRRRWREDGQAGAPLERRRRSVCGEARALLLRRVLAGRAAVRPGDAPGGLDINRAAADDGRTVEPEQRDLRRAGILRAGTGPQLLGLAARSEVGREALGVGGGRGQAERGRENSDAEARETSDHAGPLVTEPRGRARRHNGQDSREFRARRANAKSPPDVASRG